MRFLSGCRPLSTTDPAEVVVALVVRPFPVVVHQALVDQVLLDVGRHWMSRSGCHSFDQATIRIEVQCRSHTS